MFLISSCDVPLAQRAFRLALHSSLFGPDGAVIYEYIVTNSINSLLIGSRCTCIPNGAHTNQCLANLAHASKHIKNSEKNLLEHLFLFHLNSIFVKISGNVDMHL